MKDEFIPLSWFGVLLVFASGFILSDAITDWRHGRPVGLLVIGVALLLLAARSDARRDIQDGLYRGRGFRSRTGAAEKSKII